MIKRPDIAPLLQWHDMTPSAIWDEMKRARTEEARLSREMEQILYRLGNALSGDHDSAANLHSDAETFAHSWEDVEAFLRAVDQQTERITALEAALRSAEAPHRRGCARPYLEPERPCSCGLDALLGRVKP